jgi:alkanesulfonate monooxygenase SsuD/methylene tetrahydromethanopterin reductase-like flavin-dependent oxidoreductase (luciferase family)
MQVGIDSFAAAYLESSRAVSTSDRLLHLVEQIEHADQAGLDAFGIGEHHRKEYLDSAPAIILAAAAARTRRIRLTSAVTVLSAADPVRVFQEFATLDLLSQGRAEMVVGRGSSIEAFPLFGFRLEDYDALFAEKLDLLLTIRESEHVHWSGRFRAPLTGQGVYPETAAEPAADLAGRWRNAAIVRARRRTGTAADGRDHRGRAEAVPPVDRSVSRDRSATRTRPRSIEGRCPRAGLRRRDDAEGRR